MTVDEYMSDRYFPLTTQEGLTLEQQTQLDAFNYDEYMDARHNHEPLSDVERAVGRELEAKHAARGAVMREAAGVRETAGGLQQGPDGRPLPV